RANMGAKKQKSGLGQALMKTKKKSSTTSTVDIQSSAGRHVSARDGGDATVALASYLEGSSLDDFLASAVLANREFQAVKESMVFVGDEVGPQVSVVEKQVVPEMSFTEMKVPRRPKWDSTTTAEELNRLEKEAFLDWRRDIALLEQSAENLEVTPFEKNLEVWRQLWHVRERSDIMVQIVDARNPLFYRSKDLDTYAKEGEVKRRTLLVINKSDFLSERQRTVWGEYFESENVEFVFFSAKNAQLEIDELAKLERKALREEEEGEYTGKAEGDEDDADEEDENEEEDEEANEEVAVTEPETESKPEVAVVEETASAPEEKSRFPLLTREELLAYMSDIAAEVKKEVGIRTKDKGLIKFGMVGFPNVGKSSVINALLGASTFSHKTQRVAVGATPGKTKHFQTLILSSEIMLCDCPGLVFPSFVNSKAEMYCCGVLPISQLRDHVGPCRLMCSRIPKRVFERTYGITIATSKVASETDPVDVYNMLEAYARNRGYTTTGKGGPDTSRAGRDLLRDYVKGKLLYCHPPPDLKDPTVFDPHVLAMERFPDIAEELLAAEVEVESEKQEVVPDFDTNTVDKPVMSKRLKNHGRKGRKGRDKNPYEDMDLPVGATLVKMNGGGKKRNKDKYGPPKI
ncbi:TPA: hypothetical protein N0F65_012067, partial [Lagenidium giganteum]